MKFEVDNQTLRDLDIFERIKEEKSIHGLFDNTQSLGGWKKIYHYLSTPSTDLEEITNRKDAISFLETNFPMGFNIDKDALGFAEYYIKQGNYPTKMPSKFIAIERMLVDKISTGDDYYLAVKGVNSTLKLLKSILIFSKALDERLKSCKNAPHLLVKFNNETQRLLKRPQYADINEFKRLKTYDIAKYDYIFRNSNKEDIHYFLNLIYEYDAFFSIALASQKNGFSYPEVLPEDANCLEIEGLFHPFIDKAVANDVRFDGSSNLLFITGPNMAGKSTFLKALAVSVYLAHAGFPVPASKMKLSILSGVCTTINISDNLNTGYSHFYAEVMRIKNVANRLKEKNNMLVLFDELFRGTNVKDAYDGTLAIVSAFAKVKTSFFVISTHIVEVAQELNEDDNINFSYFEIRNENGQPTYTYKLRKGVSEVRLGMYIIEKERVIDIIKEIK